MKNLLFILFLISSLVYSQQFKISNSLQEKFNRVKNNEQLLVWVYFNTKEVVDESLLKTTLSNRALNRRNKKGISEVKFDFTDVPISKSNINSIKKLGIVVKQKSKWLNAVSCYATNEQVSAIAKLKSVSKISAVRKFTKNKKQQFDELKGIQLSKVESPSNINYLRDYGSSLTQNEVINTAAVHDLGYTGEGILICLMDAGFDQLSHEVFSNMNILNTWDFVNNDSDVEDGIDAGEGSHGTATLSLIGGYKEGTLIGTAFGADYILAKTENTDSETPLEEDNWIAAAEWADSIGADVFSTSLGYLDFDSPYQSYTYDDMDGNTAAITIAADLAVKKGIVVFNSAGNNGSNSTHNTLGAPADGDSVLAIGAVYSDGSRVYFSSVGPTADGRIKPDFMAMGSGTYAAGNGSDTHYKSFSGTSAACPLAAGVAALLLQKDYNLTPMEIREILRNTSNNSSAPNKFMGWGILNALDAINQIPTVKFNLKVLLEGFYDSNNHEMKLDINSLIPKKSPYSQNARRVKNISSDISDWILVELRETPNGEAISSKSFMLRNDGVVVSDDGDETLEISAVEGDYYIVVKHRNHMRIMSSNPVSLTSN